MNKGLLIFILSATLFIQIVTQPTFQFERHFFIANGQNMITSITSSDNDIYLFMKKDSNNYIELHKDKSSPGLFVFDLKETGIYTFKYKKGEEENEINEKIKVYESFDKLIKFNKYKKYYMLLYKRYFIF